jgi:hypothetical protein
MQLIQVIYSGSPGMWKEDLPSFVWVCDPVHVPSLHEHLPTLRVIL